MEEREGVEMIVLSYSGNQGRHCSEHLRLNLPREALLRSLAWWSAFDETCARFLERSLHNIGYCRCQSLSYVVLAVEISHRSPVNVKQGCHLCHTIPSHTIATLIGESYCWNSDL